jgi:hypothetical protein
MGNEINALCNKTTEMWDGEAACNRVAGHKVDVMTRDNREDGEFHQEAFEGWVWDNNGAVG